MLENTDIEQAKSLFKEWDLHHSWHRPIPTFVDHCKKKSKESLELAKYLLNKIENTEVHRKMKIFLGRQREEYPFERTKKQ
ncbi:MAG: hypothetical protein KJ597_02905 [Nanoarchaeota archaeon]|nr:hypothetical protein [Nanoarchaeota archaeon]